MGEKCNAELGCKQTNQAPETAPETATTPAPANQAPANSASTETSECKKYHKIKRMIGKDQACHKIKAELMGEKCNALN